MSKDLVSAAIITYNPDISQLTDTISNLVHQVKKIFIVDNNSKNQSDITKTLLRQKQVEVIQAGKNLGISGGLNLAVHAAEKENFKYILLCDQDSNIKSDLVEKYLDAYKKYDEDDRLAIINSKYSDNGIITSEVDGIQKNPKSLKPSNPTKLAYIDRTINSVSLLKISAYQNIGPYDENMFMDLVDFDFCYRLKQAGYKIGEIDYIGFEHKIGDRKTASFLWKTINFGTHSALRDYDFAKNTIYFWKKHGRPSKKTISTILKLIIIRACFERSWSKFKALLSGLVAGLKAKVAK
jgi:rhamnosyltransferase